MPTPSEIQAKAQQMAEKGIDARTIHVHFETVLGRSLEQPEKDAVMDAWRASAPARHQRYRDRQQAAADEARRSA